MEVITIQSEAFHQLVSKIDDISAQLDAKKKAQPFSEPWLDIQETCQLLKVSKRTLQGYRDNGTLSFSQIAGKIYFKASDIEAHLIKHYNKAFKK